VPGTGQIDAVFANPRADSTIGSIVGGAAGYAFTEQNDRRFGQGGWRLWYVASAGSTPVELDRGVAERAPTLAMDDRRIVWAAFDGSPGPASDADWLDSTVSELRMVALPDVDDVITLAHIPARDGLMWYPQLNGDGLWYGIIHGDCGQAQQDDYYLERLDLVDRTAPPARFPDSGRGFAAVADDAVAVWKLPDAGFSALNWGSLYLTDRDTGTTALIQRNAGAPSLGSRYVAFEDMSNRSLNLFDLSTRTRGSPVDLTQPAGRTMIGGESVAGDLLTWFEQDDASVTVMWARLPH
jgi:hypothetical protein